jgi:2-polyprenyl-6-methoxyphenol hydroxylase-like FAD-dependent oxidoreductase
LRSKCGFGVERIEQSDEEVTIHASGETFRGRWLVGCDGGRSVVRKQGDFEFVGTDPEFTGYSVQVEMSDSSKLSPGRHYTPTGMYTYSSPGTIAMVDFDGALSTGLSPAADPAARKTRSSARIARIYSAANMSNPGLRATQKFKRFATRGEEWIRANSGEILHKSP